jgi:Domain of unknown function (DUF4410)
MPSIGLPIRFGRIALMVFAAQLVAACAQSSLMVSQPPARKAALQSVQIVAGDSTVPVDPQVARLFETELRKDLYEGAKKFAQGDELTLSYRFIQLDQGSKAARFWLGFGAGKGSLTIEITYKSKEGAELGRINVGGEIIGGVTGGEFDSAVTKAAEEAANYTFSNFH